MLILFLGIGNNQLLFGLMALVEFGDASVDFGMKFGILHLVDNRSIFRFVNRKSLVAIGANEFFHLNGITVRWGGEKLTYEATTEQSRT